jgi:NADH-quinone oxidoreductase subunit J
MTALGFLFYLFAAVILVSAAMAVTRADPLAAVVWAVLTFLASGALFVVLGAPLPGALEVVVYAGAIMVLFCFIIMLLGLHGSGGAVALSRLIWPGVLAGVLVVGLLAVAGRDPRAQAVLPAAMAGPRAVGRALFSDWWLAVETVSVLLFAALAAVILLGRAPKSTASGGPAA